ncbi:hypothetical protein SAMN04488128_1011160 [Chitinophaga eiseniae]|uniref:Uncharacterized protein n=1 Tax=Chitinophaga eiseniae TaxID=634771 RepID=A0A1T4MLZ9_9BACT|nr:hypothetical protein SAMN04488128_1011160 [Chitinophaga eiseniae]
MQQSHLSRLMRLSWRIQRQRRVTRSKALFSAWAILLNEDITVWFLVKKHSHSSYANRVNPEQLTLLVD